MSIFLYNPDKKDKPAFLDEFVIRTRIFDDMFREISTDKMIVPEQHYMIVGPRGAGKTSMLLRLKYAVEDDPVLSKRVIPVMFGEEQYNIGELGNLWERIAEYLEDYHGFEGITAEIEKYIHRDDYEEATFRILIKHLDQREQNRIMLLIDNIGQLFDKFEINEIRRLREILQTWPHIRLVAGSPVILHYIVDYDQPLHEFFKIIRLNSLTDEEAMTLLRKLAVVHHEEEKIERILAKTPERVATLNTLSGGIPRTVVLLFKVFVDNEHGNALSDLEKILDAVTPLYKHRMDDLPPQQQKIIDAVALHWEPMEVKDIRKAVRLESKVISAQLRQLEKNQVIEKYRTKTKNHQYQLKERFFNIWYLMRYGRKMDRNKVIWLVKFLEAWCEKGEIEKRIRDYVKKVREGALDGSTMEIYGLTYSFFDKIKIETKLRLKESLPAHLSSNIKINDRDLLNTFEKEMKKGNLNKAITTILNVHLIKEDNRDWVLNYLEKNESLLEPIANQVVKYRMDNVEPEKELNFLYFRRTLAYALTYESVTNAVIWDKREEVVALTDYLMSLIESDQQDIELSIREQTLLLIILIFLLSGEYYGIVTHFLTRTQFADKRLSFVSKLAKYYMALKTNDEIEAYTISAQLQSFMSQERIDNFAASVAKIKLIFEERRSLPH
ncbi:hypothetical protein HHL17_08220 [Chitinophaga sp. G-6-1-13]|uniref:AAA+ ATPase domain-containing protein n=1 Tax=Chitinophaga fulva TaxID=2728842 RepID=A0A848GK02_9BACT|nr:hypothetical protein [Chitinophaga fulva]NML37183.1 hypothetical protein [Chitinophaga fulva]